jgi:hypothetical protein
MAQDGRKSRNQHSMVMRIESTTQWSKNEARNFAEDFAGAIAAVMFVNTSFLRMRFVELDSNNKAIPYSGFGQPLTLVGRNAFAEGDGPSSPQVCLNIEKSADGGDPAITKLRHCLSALEYAAFEINSAVPARFNIAPTGSWNPGSSLSANIKKAFADNNMRMKLPPAYYNGAWHERVITELETQDFSNSKNTKKRVSVEAATAAAARREILQLRRKAWRLWDKIVGTDAPAALLSAIRDIVVMAVARYAALPAAIKILFAFPDFPNVPALPAPA